MKMDEFQSEAVSAVGTNILVSASAGAGKTRVLVERLMKRCIEDRIAMNEILAVTFTEAAAAEMKNRIAAGLQEKLQSSSSSEEETWIRSQIILLEDADITTIDSFCLNLIKKYYSVIGLDPASASSILDESSQKAMMETAFYQAVASCQDNDPDALMYVLNTTSTRPEDYDTLKTTIFNIKSLAEQYSDPEEWLDRMAESYSDIHHLNDLPHPVYEGFFQQLRFYFNSIQELMEEMRALAEQSEKVIKKINDLESAYTLFMNCQQALKEENYDQFRELFLMFGAEQKTPSDSKAEAYTSARDQMYETCAKLTAILYDSDTLISDINELLPTARLLSKLTSLTISGYREEKRRRAVMDFTDMEQYAWEILIANDREVAKLYRARLKEVMVDEFQDTSLLQDQIITAIANEGTIFRVGDVKQSIYRFRGARPALMRGLMNDPSIKNITLCHNYRSRSTIIEYSNLLFSRLMNIEGCEDRYTEQDIVTPGTSAQCNPDTPPIQLVLINMPEPLASQEDSDEQRIKGKQAKAEWIASEMIRLHELGYRWNDFSVLVRSHAEKIELARVFEQCGLPYDIDTRQGFYNSDLCQYILALLRCAVNPEDELSLLCVLCGEMYSFTDEQLAQLKLNHGSVRDGIRNEYPDVLPWISSLYDISRYSIPGMLDEIAFHNSFYEHLAPKDRANFDFLYERAVASASHHITIYDLIETMETGAEERSSNASCRSKDDDVVTVSTIHQSKGLQYKVVFLWSTGGNALLDTTAECILDSEIGYGLKHYDLPFHTSRPSIFRIAATYRQNIADVEEYSRVLYVALTRAEERMYIVDTADDALPYRDKLTMRDLMRRKGITGLITAAMKEQPGLYEVHTVPLEAPLVLEQTEPKYVEELPHFLGNAVTLPPVRRPSTHELRFLPDLEPGSSSRGSTYGTLIHETIAGLPNRLWTTNDFDTDVLRPHDVEAILNFGMSDLYHEALNMTIYKELPFYTEDPNTKERMMGVMDFVGVSDEKILLIDFKTDALPLSEIKTRYSDQLNAYRSALSLLYPGRPIQAYAWSFHNRSAVEINEAG
ncbi:MAG: UvrD-helicase domain-containing protein [Solobacterium sp.]|nr:UvrD-helicase domain-containing protein [Solobacterium sp.]